MKKKILTVKIGRNVIDDLDRLKKPKEVSKFPGNVVYFRDSRQLYSVLSARKLELLQYLSEITDETVTKIAAKLERKKEAVSRDIHCLADLGLIEIRKKGTKSYPKLEFSAIQIMLSSKKAAGTASD